MAGDYDILLTNFEMKLKVRCCPKSIRIPFDMDTLKVRYLTLTKVFQTQIGGEFAALNLIHREIDTIANEIIEGLLVTVEEVPWRKRRKSRFGV